MYMKRLERQCAFMLNINKELLERLINVLKMAEIGQFNEKSWHYWHYRLHLAKPELVPLMPQNRFNA